MEGGHALEVAREPGERSQKLYELKSLSNLGTSRPCNFGKLLLWHGGELRISGRKEVETVEYANSRSSSEKRENNYREKLEPVCRRRVNRQQEKERQ